MINAEASKKHNQTAQMRLYGFHKLSENLKNFKKPAPFFHFELLFIIEWKSFRKVRKGKLNKKLRQFSLGVILLHC